MAELKEMWTWSVLLLVSLCKDQKMKMLFTPGLEQYKKTDGYVCSLTGCPKAAWLGCLPQLLRGGDSPLAVTGAVLIPFVCCMFVGPVSCYEATGQSLKSLFLLL